MCPGIVKTDLSRNYKAKGVLFTVVVGLYVGLFGKSAANGARTYMAAVTTGESEHVSISIIHPPLYFAPSIVGGIRRVLRTVSHSITMPSHLPGQVRSRI